LNWDKGFFLQHFSNDVWKCHQGFKSKDDILTLLAASPFVTLSCLGGFDDMFGRHSFAELLYPHHKLVFPVSRIINQTHQKDLSRQFSATFTVTGILWHKLLIDKCSILHFVNFLGNSAAGERI
jgi:hypothetical protein